jgi:hypothetical protein
VQALQAWRARERRRRRALGENVTWIGFQFCYSDFFFFLILILNKETG